MTDKIDIGPMIAAFLSDDNRWVNGQRIECRFRQSRLAGGVPIK
jgi:hypothetical protein